MGKEFFSFLDFLIRNIDGKFGRWVRFAYYRRRLGGCGKNVVIEPGVFFQNPKYVFIGNNVWIDRYAILIAGPFTSNGRRFHEKPNPSYQGKPGELRIDDGCHISPFTLLQSHAGLSIGKGVTIASGAKVYTISHHYRNLNDPNDTKRYSFSSMASKEDQFLVVSPVVIMNGAAVGLNSVVLPGTTINEGTWLGVLSHVEGKSTDEDSVYTSEQANKK